MNRRRGAQATWRRANMSLWLWPGVTVLVAYFLGLWSATVPPGSVPVADTIFRGGSSTGRGILTAMVGGLVTALSVIFSLTITGLSLVHQQYSPRLLRNFMRDRATKITLGVFAGTVAYILAVLQMYPSSQSGAPIPRLAITVSMAMFLACVGIVAFFAQHITQSIRVHSVMARVTRETGEAIDLSLKAAERQSITGCRGALPDPPAGALDLASWKNGYIREIDVAALARMAAHEGVSIRLRPMIGDHVVDGTTLAWAWPNGAAGSSDGAAARRDVSSLRDALRRHVSIGPDRSEDTDVAFGLRQLVDVANRSLSPSLNDPYTAMQAIDHLATLIAKIARDGVPDGVARDDSGALLVAAPGVDLADYVRLAVRQPTRYGATEPAVIVRLLKLIGDVGALAPEPARPAMRQEVDRIRAYAEDRMTSQDEVETVRNEADTASAILDGRTPPLTTSPVRL